MKLYYYDIWDGDKGVIFAKDMDEAISIYRTKYDFPVAFVDIDAFDSGICNIELVTEESTGLHVIEEY